MRKTIVLLDVDGVLIRAQGYRASVKATMNYLFQRLNQPHLIPPGEADMQTFEAESIIFEWDSVALSMAAILSQVPHLLGDTLVESIDKIAVANIKLEQPDYQAVARRVPKPSSPDIKPSRAALGTLFPEHPVFVEILGDAHSPNALITQIFQHFVLGHEQYARTYNRAPVLETGSLLGTLDIPILTPENAERLERTEHLQPVIYTARPGLPPTFVNDWLGYSPEAEIAQKLLKLHRLPVIGYGRVQWLAQQTGAHPASYVKPSPVQALAAIYSAILYGSEMWEERGLRSAAVDGQIPEEVTAHPLHIIVCEDSTGGIRGVRQAVECLQKYHDVTFTAVGVADGAVKREALKSAADYVAEDVNEGLAWALGW